MNRGRRILEAAREAGFDLAGLAPLEPPPDGDRFDAWLDAGRAGGMDWLERNRARIRDPRGLAARPASLLVVGLSHARAPVELPGGGRVARYAAGRDYHNRVTKALKRLRRSLEAEGLAPGGRAIVDAGPLLERSHARVAGLGFASKAANLLHPDLGPWFFLGELVLERPFDELDPGVTPPAGSCGTCTACLDACPTGALVAPGELDARLCLSYLTIEHRGPVDPALRADLGDWAFGCDVCSEVCPWGGKAEDRGADWGRHAALDQSLVELLTAPAETFAETWRGSAMQRPRREGLARNAALVLGNRPSEAGLAALGRALAADPSPLVREAAGWALARAHGDEPGTLPALERALEDLPPGPLGALLAATRDRLADGAS